MEGRTQRLHNTLGSIERANLRYGISGICALAGTRFQPALFFAQCQEGLQETLLCACCHQTSPELREDSVIKARISQLQAQAILPVKTTAYRVGCLAIRQIFHKLEDGDQGKPPRSEE